MTEDRNKVAVVAGGAGALGGRVARGLIEDGHQVIVLDRAPVGNDSERWSGLVVDLTDEDQVKNAVAHCVERWGVPQVLVNCQGWSPKQPNGRASGPAQMPADEFMRVIQANLLSAYLTMRAVIPSMADAGTGRVVNVSSTSGLTGRTTASAAYAAAKSGVDTLTRMFSSAYGSHGVLVTSVAPGKFESPDWPDDPDLVRRYTTEIPLRRLAKADEVCDFIRFLVSPRNTYITGHPMVIDGGRLA